MRTAFIVLSLFYYFSFSAQNQQVLISRNFPGGNKSVPLHVLNNHPDYFLVLRYNKTAHDFFIEKRSKPHADFLRVTTLKLDSVNAGWFDYEKLNYLFYEVDKTIYFVFERLRNNSSELFVKTVDSLGHASGFQLIHSLHAESRANIIQMNFYLQSGNRLLIVSEQDLGNYNVLKRVTLFNLNSRKVEWNKNLSVENLLLCRSEAFTCDESGNLYYLMNYFHLTGFKRKYSGFSQLQLPVYYYDSLCMVANKIKTRALTKTLCAGTPYLQSTALLVNQDRIIAAFRFGAENEKGEVSLKFCTGIFDLQFDVLQESRISVVKPELIKSLTYYDGGDSPSASEKEFRIKELVHTHDGLTGIEERLEENYSKEIFIWNINGANAEITWQQVLPRKIYYFKDRGRFRYLGEIALVTKSGDTYCAFLENRSNKNFLPGSSPYSKYKKQNELKSGALIAYRIGDSENKKQKVSVYESNEYDFVPLRYSGIEPNLVFYLNKGKAEKFAIWSPED